MERDNNTAILEARDVCLNYGYIRAVRGVSILVREKQVVSLLGPNGAGKSTLIAGIMGVKRPVSGTIKYMGEDITRKSTDRIVVSGISITPEGRGSISLLTVKENLLLGLLYVKKDKKKCLNDIYERFPMLLKKQNQIAGTLSGGEQQILEIARVIISEPNLIILDEPTLGLSPVAVEDIFVKIKELKDEGYTILVSEQNAKKALEVSDYGYVLETGRLRLEGDSKKLKDDPWVHKAYLGQT